MKKILFLVVSLGVVQYIHAATYTFNNETGSDVSITTRFNNSNDNSGLIFTVGSELTSQNSNQPLYGIEVRKNGKVAHLKYDQGLDGDGTWLISEQNGNLMIEKTK